VQNRTYLFVFVLSIEIAKYKCNANDSALFSRFSGFALFFLFH